MGVKVLMVKLATAETAVLQAARTGINRIAEEFQLYQPTAAAEKLQGSW